MAQREERKSELMEEGVVPRDPEDRPVQPENVEAIREKNLDKTLADSFPTSDPPSSIPDPSEEED